MLLIDGDILTYMVGFICERRWYEHTCPVYDRVMVFQGKRDIKEYNKNLVEDVDYFMKRESDSEDKAFSVIAEIIQSWLIRFKRNKYRVFLTDTDLTNNFRYKLCKNYKANRKGSVKPLLYDAIRHHLIKQYSAEVVVGIEADDALGMSQTRDTIIISKDKDLLQVPGLHYSISSNKIIRAGKIGGLALYEDGAKDKPKKKLTGHGFKWFCAQMLLGDDVDNIKGLHRVGPVGAHNILHGAKTKESAWGVVKDMYKVHKREEDLLTNAQLLWIMKTSNDYFNEEKHCV